MLLWECVFSPLQSVPGHLVCWLLLFNIASAVEFYTNSSSNNRNPWIYEKMCDQEKIELTESFEPGDSRPAIPDCYVYNILVQNIVSCRVASVVIYVDKHHRETSSLFTRTLMESGILMIDYDVTHDTYSDIKQKVVNSYIYNKILTSVIMTSDPQIIMAAAQQAFHANRRGNTALMLQRTKWVILVCPDHQMEGLETQLEFGTFDNVVVFELKRHGIIKRRNVYFIYPHISTLMAKGSMPSRRFRRLGWQDLRHQSCTVFPNEIFGMNKRELTMIAKPNMLERQLSFTTDPTTKELYFSGFLVDVMDCIAEVLNFTYSVSLWNGTWDTYIDAIDRREYDVGFSVWFPLDEFIGRMDITSAIFYDEVKAFYLHPVHDSVCKGKALFILCPFPPMVYVFIGSAMVFTAIVYSALRFLSFKNCKQNDTMVQTSSEKSNHNIDDKTKLHDKFNVNMGCTKPHTNFIADMGCSKLKYCLGFYPFITSCLSMLWIVFISGLNQDHLPRPTWTSLRICLWSWALLNFAVNVIYSGFLTSEMVQPTPHAFFASYQAIADSDYRKGTLARSGLKDLMDKSTDPLLQKLGSHMEILEYSDDIYNDVIDKLKQNYVFFNHRIATIGLFHNRTLPHDMKVVEDSLLSSHLGFALPFNSEMTEAISKTIERMHENGVIINLKRKYGLSDDLDSMLETSEHVRDSSLTIHFRDILCLLLIVSILLAFCLSTLVIENMLLCLIVVKHVYVKGRHWKLWHSGTIDPKSDC